MLNRNLQAVVDGAMHAAHQASAPDDHVHKREGMWWYWDAWRRTRRGPFHDEAEARREFTAHQLSLGTTDAVPKVATGELDVR